MEAGDWVVLLCWTAAVSFGVSHHVPWSDEAQAWLLARDSSLSELLLRRLHYEGAPALWPLILRSANRLHLSYAGLCWLGAACALVGIALLLRSSPFPRIVRWLLPFTFFLGYQYAVIARPYVLFPALLFAVCAVYTRERPRPVLFAVCAGLLANVSLHAAILACLFALFYLQRLRGAHLPARRIALAAAVFLLFALLSASVAFPAPDVALAGPVQKTATSANPLLLKLVPPERLPPGAPPLDAPLDPTAPGSNTPSAPSPAAATAGWVVALGKTIVLSADAACFPIARSNLLALAFLASLILWLRARRSLSLLLPYVVTLVVGVQIWVYDHHTGIFLLALVAAVWIALDSPSPAAPPPVWLNQSFAVLSLAVILLQIGWTAHCLAAETRQPYDPGRETAAFLERNFAGKRVAGFAFESVATQAWAGRSLFVNQPHAYWLWSVPVLIDRRRTEALNLHPDAVVVGDNTTRGEVLYNQWYPFVPAGRRPYAGMLSFWQQHGYRETHRFCGDRVTRLGANTTFCEIVLEPANRPAPSSPRP